MRGEGDNEREKSERTILTRENENECDGERMNVKKG